MATLKRSEQAERDLLQIWVRIAEDNFDAADKFVDEINDRLEDIAEMPGLGRARDELAPGLRSFPVGDYLLLYRATDTGSELVRVVHGARNLRGLFRPDQR
jgi:toxin ParE1/3/4